MKRAALALIAIAACGRVGQRDPVATTTRLVLQYAKEAYPAWRIDHPKKTCPDRVDELDQYANRYAVDAWDRPLRIYCTDRGARVVSLGPDGIEGTSDDITSD